MAEIFLTGYNSEDFVKKVKNGEKGGCYLCKRDEGEKSVYFNKEDLGLVPVDIGVVSVKRKDIKFNFLLCQECMILIEGILQQNEHESLVGNLGPNMN
jgi:hypothetical protein